MAATKSTLNSKMPKPSNISFGSSVKKRGTVAYTGENGKLGTCKVYFKQNKTTYPFQVQYRTRSRYNETNEKKKNAKWTKWSDWKNARAFTSPTLGTVAAKAKNTAKPVNKWMKANKGVNKKSSYVIAMNLTGHAIGSAYDGRQFEFRIRTFSKAKAKHGSMAHQVLTVWKKTAITGEKLFVGEYGGMDLRFKYKGNDNGQVIVNSVKDSNGMEIMRPECIGKSYAWSFDSYYSGTLATGYTPAQAIIPISDMNRAITYGEQLTCDIVYKNEYGAPTKFALTAAQAMDSTVGDAITYTVDKYPKKGVVVVKLKNPSYQTEIIKYVNVIIKYKDSNGLTRSIYPELKNVCLDGSSETLLHCAFFPPLNVDCKISFFIATPYGPSRSFSTNVRMNGSSYTFTRMAFDDELDALLAWTGVDEEDDENYIIASAYGNVDYSIQTKKENIYLNPLGANVAWGTAGYKAPDTTITFKADIIDVADEDIVCRKIAWEYMRGKLDNTYIFRTPYGDEFQCLIDNMTITKIAAHVYQINITAREIEEII